MSNDPNDRFMISDLSSKLSAYINGEYSDQTSQTKDPAEIGDVFASEIKPEEPGRKLPGDELFTDLDQALVSRADGGEETVRRQKLAEEQRQRAEETRRQQFRNEQQRQLKIREEQQRQQRLREEQQRQLKIQEEQQRQLRIQEEQRQQKLRQEKAIVRFLAESLYSFNLDQPFTSVRSGHTSNFTKLSPTVKSMPSEEALRKALAKTASADKASQAAGSYEVPKEVPSYEVPKTAPSYEVPKTTPSYEVPKESASHTASTAETFFEVPPFEATPSSFAETTHTSQSSGESRYAKSPDPSYKGYQEERRGGSKIAVIISLFIALLVVAAIFIMIRKYSTNLTGLLSGAPAASTDETASKAESTAESKVDEESRAAGNTDSNAAVESQTSASMAINEEGEIFHSDSQITDADDSGEPIPEDPNDISYLSSVNKKAAEDAIAELSDAAPKLYLSTYGIEINAGDSFNALAFVERIEDDTDDKDRLYRDISVDGLGEFDAKVPGTYELTYFCYDSAGNRSNKAKLTVIVK